MHEDKKIEIMNLQYNSLTQCTVAFLHWVIQVILKLCCLKFGLYSFTQFFIITKTISGSPFLQVKVSVVNSVGGSFCWNYATDTFYSIYTGVNVCCSYAGFEVLLQFVLVVLSAALTLVDFFVSVMKVAVSVEIMQLEVSATLMQVKVSPANMWVTIFIEIMQVGISVVIMQVVFSIKHYAHDYFYCNYAGGCFSCSHVCDSFK